MKKLISAVLALALVLGLVLPAGVTSASAAGTSAVTVYRLYLDDNGEHLFTTDYNEVVVLSTQHGWTYEGVGWYAPQSGTAVYRLYNAELQNHLYTTDLNEIRVLTTSEGWTMDFNGQPLFYSGGDVPVYRLYNRELRGLHLWTTDTNEYNVLPSEGWTQENIALYGVSPDYNGGSGSTGSSGDAPSTGDSGQTAHTHEWVPVFATVHYEEVGHYEPVVHEAWDEPVYEGKAVCSACGAYFDTAEEAIDHTLIDHDGFASYSVKEVQTGTIHHDEVTEEVWVVDEAAHDEAVVTGYVCSICGAAKEN